MFAMVAPLARTDSAPASRTRRAARLRRAEARRFVLRDYQAETIDEVMDNLRRRLDVLIECPTGSGKTAMMRVAARKLLAGRFSHALIVSPQQAIEDGFVELDDVSVEWPGNSSRPVLVRSVHVRKVRGTGESAGRALLAYLRDPRPGYAVSCTHQAFVYLVANFPTLLPKSTTGRVLMVDEAHHVGAPGLSRAVDRWAAGGGRLLFASATPCRNDDAPVVRPGMVVIRRSMAELMEAGYMPARVEHGIVAVGGEGDTVTAAEFRGDAVSGDAGLQASFVAKMVGKWGAMGRPKLIVRVPVLRGTCAAFVEALIARFARAGARVLDATGVDARKKRAILEALRDERGRTCAGSRFDVVVGIQRVIEGFDWPHASTMFTLGIPRGIPTVTQLLGRTTRPKPADYPEAYRDVSGIYFFVPTAGGKALDELGVEHSRHALMTTVFLADFAAAEGWMVARAARAGVRSGTGNPRAKGPDLGPTHGLGMADYATVRLAMAAATEGQGAGGGKVTSGSLIEAARAACPGVPEAALKAVAVGVLAADRRKGAEALGDLEREVARLSKVGPDINPDMAAAFDAILAKYRDEELEDPAALQAIREQSHAMTGRGAREWGERIAESGGVAWSEELIRAKADEYRSEYGVWPTQRSGNVAGLDAKWGAVQSWLLFRYGCGITRFLTGHDRYIGWSEALIREKAEEYRRECGEWPNTVSGKINGLDLLWGTADRWLRKNKAVGLVRFLNRGWVAGDWSNDLILRKAEEYRRIHGRWPSSGSGDIEGMSATWLSANRWLYRSGRSGLREFLTGRKRGGWSLALIRKNAEEYRARNKKWPSAASDSIDGIHSNWSAADQYLRKQHGIGLSQFLKGDRRKALSQT
jgi:hypothetical protein